MNLNSEYFLHVVLFALNAAKVKVNEIKYSCCYLKIEKAFPVWYTDTGITGIGGRLSARPSQEQIDKR